jgi:peptide/nickel transport system permease protein
MTRRTAFVLRRLGLTVPVLAAMSVIVFLVLHLVPGDPAETQLGLRATPELVAQVRENLHLNDPLPVQYVEWLKGVLVGDLGTDYASGAPVSEELRVALPVTIELALGALLVSGLVGIVLGAVAATRGRVGRSAASGFTVLGIAIPEFWMGIMLVLVFSATFAVLPPSGYVPIGDDFVGNLRSFALPVATLSIFNAALFARTTGTAMQDALASRSILFLRAKGLHERTITWKHALRNASVPIATIMGIQFGSILGGTIIIETLFDLPGVGKLLFTSVSARSYTVVQGCVLVIATMFILVNLLTDLIIGWLDPRIGDGAMT